MRDTAAEEASDRILGWLPAVTSLSRVLLQLASGSTRKFRFMANLLKFSGYLVGDVS